MASLMRAVTPRRVLGAFATTFAFAALLVAVATPPWEANDEYDHVRNVETLVGGHWYRIHAAGSGFEPHQAPLYYLTLAAYQKALLGLPSLPPAPTPAAAGGPRNLKHDVPQDGADQRLLSLLRLPGVLFGVLTVLLTAAAARRLSSDPWTPVVAAGLLCGVPKLAFLSGVVNNDNLSNVLGATVLLICAVAISRRVSSPQTGLVLGGLLGATSGMLVLSKLTAATLLPAVVAALLYVGIDRRTRVIALGALAGCFAATCGWWLVQNQVRYGDPLAATATRDHLKSVFPPLFDTGSFSHQAFDETPRGVFRSFWYISGWNQLFWQNALPYQLLWLGLAAGLAGLLRRGTGLRVPGGTHPVLSLSVLGGFLAIWYLGITTTTTSGRIGFFALPAVGLLYALGTERWRVPVPVRLLLPAAGVVMTYVAIARDVLDFYPS
jgi:hypothetical protein